MDKATFGLWLESIGFQPEVRFPGLTGKRRFRWDWADPERKIAVEYAGIMGWGASHMSINGVARDDEKTTLGQLCGWLVIRVNARTVESGDAQSWVEHALAMRGGDE